MSFVCPVHNEYVPEGHCRWCEPEPVEHWMAPPTATMTVDDTAVAWTDDFGQAIASIWTPKP